MFDFFYSSFGPAIAGEGSLHAAALSWIDRDKSCDVGRGTEDLCGLPDRPMSAARG
jgi:hypothetical protein